MVRWRFAVRATDRAHLLLVKPFQPAYRALPGGTPDPICAANRTPDGAEIDEHTGGCDEGRHAGVNGKESIWNPAKKQSGHRVDRYGQRNADIGDVQLPRLMRPVDEWPINAHRPPKR